MTKRRKQRQIQEEVALSHKQMARARLEKKHRQRTMLAIGSVMAVIVAILLVGMINELIIKPGQPVARVGDVEISTAAFQERVKLERHQTIALIEEYAALFGVEQVYSIAAQLDEYELVGEQVLNGMVDETLIRQGAVELGITVSPAEVSQVIEEQVGYYRAGTPTPAPTFTPRPSPTPITPTGTVATPLPPITPRPSPTAVTEAAFNTLYQDQVRGLRRSGVDERTYRAAVELQMLVDKVREKLSVDQPTVADQVQLDVIYFATQEDANGFLDRLLSGEAFDDLIAEARANTEDEITAGTVSWTPFEELSGRFDAATAQIAFSLEIGGYSQVVRTVDERFAILQVTDHEEREISSGTLQTREEQLFNSWLEGLRAAASIEVFDTWRNRVPRTPELDIRTLIPTPTAPAPTEG